MPYMTVDAINAATNHIVSNFGFVTGSSLPETSVEGRAVKALKISANPAPNRTGVLFLGGTHARELINPELVVSFGFRLCQAYDSGSGLAFGPKTYSANLVRVAVESLDIHMVPMVNPDGRHHCLKPGGYRMWRKNRADHGLTCKGVDLNRNYDFLWSSGIGTSTNSCSDVFKGPGAFSEPETRNVRWLLDTYTELSVMIDIHSYSELVLYPWGHDESQTTDPTQNFQNPAWDGARGSIGGYAEYIPPADLTDHIGLANRMRDAIAAVRGRSYTVQTGYMLYPTSGTTHDYAYARNFIDTGRRRLLAYTLETARQFQPDEPEKDQVIEEVSSGLMECLIGSLCPASVVERLLGTLFPLSAMRIVRDTTMMQYASGRFYRNAFQDYSLELVHLVTKDKKALKAAGRLMRVASRFVGKGSRKRKISDKDIEQVRAALDVFEKRGSDGVRTVIEHARVDLKTGIEGLTLKRMFRYLDKRHENAAHG